MPRPRPKKKRNRRCRYSNKLCYPSEEEAKRQLRLIHFFDLPWRKEAGYYHCSYCGSWHLTSQQKGEKQ